LDQAAPARGQGRQKARPKKKSPSKSEKVAQDRRVEKLRTAARKANASRARPKAKTVKKPSQRKTRIDDRILAQDEKALDDLLTARLDRLK